MYRHKPTKLKLKKLNSKIQKQQLFRMDVNITDTIEKKSGGGGGEEGKSYKICKQEFK